MSHFAREMQFSILEKLVKKATGINLSNMLYYLAPCFAFNTTEAIDPNEVVYIEVS
jgi:hypothetical protein